MKIIFMGTPDFSVPVLEHLVKAGHEVAAVYSQPPRPKGRGQKEQKSPVHQCAEHHNIKVRTPKNFKSDQDIQAFIDLRADVAVVVAYGLLLPKAILDAPQMGCLNIHASLLPRWRGAAPIQRAIMAGDKTTAVQIMQMEEGLDTGPVGLSEEVTITDEMTAGELHDELSGTSGPLIVSALKLLEEGKLDFKAQTTQGVTYAKKINKEQCHIDWQSSVTDIHNHIRGLSPWPGAWCEVVLDEGKQIRLKVLRARVTSGDQKEGFVKLCANGAIELLKVQLAGKKAMSAEELLRGVKIKEIL